MMAGSSENPSNDLWVGNLAPDVTDPDLTSLFQKYGPVDTITSYASRGFAFIYFRNINDAMKAKEVLQGSVFHGTRLRVEFSKPVKPCKSLWVAGISKSVSKEELEDQFKGFGKIQEYKFIRDRNTAYIDFARLEDATEALKNLNGRNFGGEKIHVDYRRLQPARREQGPEFQEVRDGHLNRSFGHPNTHLMPQDLARNYFDPMQVGFTRQHPFQLPVGNLFIPNENHYIWRGIIAKCGKSLCNARCVPFRKIIEFEIPHVVDCFARTGLDMLTKHFADAVGFNIVCFLPENEEDFASYTEFLRYLSSKDRAGVANLVDGTNLFVVPPSDFLTNVLKVVGPDRLYGVILKFAHNIPSAISLPSESNQPQYIHTPQISSSEDAYDAYPTNPVYPNTALYPENPVHQINTATLTQARAYLTPELIATLTKMLPANKLSSLEGTTGPTGAFTGMPASDNVVAPAVVQQQSWRYEQQDPGQDFHHISQFGNQFNNQTQVFSQLQAHPQVLNMPNHYYSQRVTGFGQVQDHNLNLQAQGYPPQTLTSTNISQGTQFSAQPHVDGQLHLGRHLHVVSDSGIARGIDLIRLYGSSASQPPAGLTSFPNQTHDANVYESQVVLPDASGMGLATQMQQPQYGPYRSNNH